MVLFFNRDCAGGVGPAVEALRMGGPEKVGGALIVLDMADTVAGMVVAAVVAEDVGIVPKTVEGDTVEALEALDSGFNSEGFPRENIAPAPDCVEGAVTVVPEVAVAVLFNAPSAGNTEIPDGAAAGVDDGVVDEAVPSRPWKMGFWGVMVVAGWAANDGWEIPVRAGAASRFGADFASDWGVKAGVCVFRVVPSEAVGIAPRMEVASSLCSDSCVLFLLKVSPNKPPGCGSLIPDADALLCPNMLLGFNRKDDGAADVVDVAAGIDGAVVKVGAFWKLKKGFELPGAEKMDCPWPAELPAGGRPAGVVDARLKREPPPPDGAGVDVLLPKRFFDESLIPVVVVCPKAGASPVLLGVWMPKKGFAGEEEIGWSCVPKPKDGVCVLPPVLVLPRVVVCTPKLLVVPKGDVQLFIVDAPILPKTPPPEPPPEVLGFDPNRLLEELERPSLEPPPDVGAFGLSDMATLLPRTKSVRVS
jgi:hypothetical protein